MNLQKLVSKLRWWDIILIKWASLFFGLWLAKIWPAVLVLETHWYLILAFGISLIPIRHWFGK